MSGLDLLVIVNFFNHLLPSLYLCSVYLVKVLIIYPMPGQTLSAYRALQKNNLKKLLNTLCTSKSWKIERGCWLVMWFSILSRIWKFSVWITWARPCKFWFHSFNCYKVEELLMEIKETEAEVARWREACELEVEAGKNEIGERDKVVNQLFSSFDVNISWCTFA